MTLNSQNCPVFPIRLIPHYSEYGDDGSDTIVDDLVGGTITTDLLFNIGRDDLLLPCLIYY